ncbi:MAG: hypothetical protein M0T75_07940 [Chloroflexi bacterium]|nr:hypothetical protein [Chloroflexota bacterium]
MTREQLFEQRLADWLEDGPFEAPERALEAAIHHARAHPRRQRRLAGLWRTAMTRLQVSGVQPRPPHRFSFAAVAAAAVLVLGVVAGGTYLIANRGPDGGPPVAAPTSTATAPPTPGPSVEPSPALPAGVIATTGRSTCTTRDPGATTTVDGLERLRGRVEVCTVTQSDPRVSGTETIDFNYEDHADGTWTYWGTSHLENEGGAWAGVWTGFGPDDYTANLTVYLQGEGGYAGLQYRGTVVLSGAASAYPAEGTIEPLGPVEFTSTSTCTETVAGDTHKITVAGPDGKPVTVSETLGGVNVCIETATDPRASGTSTITFNMREAADGSWTYWGTSVLENAGGSWTSVWDGESAPAAYVANLRARGVGMGGYAGSTYLASVRLFGGPSTNCSGTIDPTP